MKRLYTLILSLAITLASANIAIAVSFNNESLNYKVMYKWGVVNKQAGHATLSLKRQGNQYITQLTAASEHWADRFYKVRDTLNGNIVINGFRPTFYEKIAHEGGEHKHDIVRYSRSGSNVTGNCTRRVVNKKGQLTKNEKRSLTAIGTTLDMLSSFYYMRSLPYNTYRAGHPITVNVFSGKRKELLTIKYIGTEKINVDKKTYNCYHIRFTFTGDGGKKTSDDMDAWISTEPDHIPIKLEGKLKVGKVQCYYTGSN